VLVAALRGGWPEPETPGSGTRRRRVGRLGGVLRGLRGVVGGTDTYASRVPPDDRPLRRITSADLTMTSYANTSSGVRSYARDMRSRSAVVTDAGIPEHHDCIIAAYHRCLEPPRLAGRDGSDNLAVRQNLNFLARQRRHSIRGYAESALLAEHDPGDRSGLLCARASRDEQQAQLGSKQGHRAAS